MLETCFPKLEKRRTKVNVTFSRSLNQPMTCSAPWSLFDQFDMTSDDNQQAQDILWSVL